MRLIGLFVFIFNVLLSNDFGFEGGLLLEEKPLFVSLGSHCEIASTLRNCGHRNAAFPFDWVVSSHSHRLAQLLQEDFQFFTDETCFVPLNNDLHSIRNLNYELVFHHEWPFSDESFDQNRYSAQLKVFRIKYQRRIARFRQLQKYPGEVFFIRNPWWEEDKNPEQVRELKEALESYFPNLNFTLVIVSYVDQNPPEIPPIDRVIEYKISRNRVDIEYSILYRSLLNGNRSGGHVKDLLF